MKSNFECMHLHNYVSSYLRQDYTVCHHNMYLVRYRKVGKLDARGFLDFQTSVDKRCSVVLWTTSIRLPLYQYNVSVDYSLW
jgi:hypothetical protein